MFGRTGRGTSLVPEASPNVESPSGVTAFVARAANQRVANLYEAKTAAILERYGSGLRVHYHTGFVEGGQRPTTAAALRAQLFESQERMLRHASDFWQLRNPGLRNLLDVGCGLGGSAIFWAQEFGARVTAITVAPSHVALVAGMARRAGVESRVRPMLCDAAAVAGENCFDAAIAIESSSLFPRHSWFNCLARVLRPGGRVFIADCFVVRSEYEEPFNRHWCGQIGAVTEYIEAAQACHFKLLEIEDVSLRAATFWTTTLELIRAEAIESELGPSKPRSVEESFRTHSLMRQGLLGGGLRELLMAFTKSA